MTDDDEGVGRDLLSALSGVRRVVRSVDGLHRWGAALVAALCSIELLRLASSSSFVVPRGAGLALAGLIGLLTYLTWSRTRRKTPREVLSIAAWIDRELELDEVLLSAADLESRRSDDGEPGRVAGLVRARASRTWERIRREQRLPSLRMTRFLPGLHFALLLFLIALWPASGEGLRIRVEDASSLPPEMAGMILIREPGTAGAPEPKPDDQPQPESDEPDESSPSPEEQPPVPEFELDPKFIQPLRRPGPSVVKEALVLEEVLAPAGSGRPRGSGGSQGEDLPPDIDTVLSRMEEVDVGRPALSPEDRDLVAKYFELLKGLGPAPKREDGERTEAGDPTVSSRGRAVRIRGDRPSRPGVPEEARGPEPSPSQGPLRRDPG